MALLQESHPLLRGMSNNIPIFSPESRGRGEPVARRPRLRAMAMVTVEWIVSLLQPKHLHCRWGRKPKAYSDATMAKRREAGPVSRLLLCLPTGVGRAAERGALLSLGCSSHDKIALSPRQNIPTASPDSPRELLCIPWATVNRGTEHQP